MKPINLKWPSLYEIESQNLCKLFVYIESSLGILPPEWAVVGSKNIYGTNNSSNEYIAECICSFIKRSSKHKILDLISDKSNPTTIANSMLLRYFCKKHLI